MARAWEKYFLLFMAISFLGWAAETVFFLLCYGEFHDRGFMTLPFCTIYGCSFLLLYALIGDPAGKPPLRYFLLCVLVPTSLELLTGYFFQNVFRLRLWSYEDYRFHFKGYICLEYALLWGILLPPCMKYIFLPVKERIFRMKTAAAFAAAVILLILSLADWTRNFVLLS